MSYALVYWITRLDMLAEIITIALVLSALITCGIGAGVLAIQFDFELVVDDNHITRFLKRLFKTSIIVLVITTLLKCFIPTTGEACLIYALPKIANSNVVQNEVPDAINNIFKIANKCLEDKLKEYTTVKE